MVTTKVSVTEAGQLGMMLEDTEYGILIANVANGSVLAQSYPEVHPGMLLVSVRGQDVSLESGKARNAHYTHYYYSHC
jgi:hypothetical protein